MNSNQLGLTTLIIAYSAGLVLIGSHDLHREYTKGRSTGEAKQLVRDLKGHSDPAARARFAGDEIAERERAKDKTKWERFIDSLRPPLLDDNSGQR